MFKIKKNVIRAVGTYSMFVIFKKILESNKKSVNMEKVFITESFKIKK